MFRMHRNADFPTDWTLHLESEIAKGIEMSFAISSRPSQIHTTAPALDIPDVIKLMSNLDAMLLH